MKIIYIVGDGRSGSTLLDSVLNNTEKSISIGEFSRFWTRYIEGTSNCGCGKNICHCDLWSKIIKETELKFSISLGDIEKRIFQLRYFKNFKNIDKFINDPEWREFCNLIKYVYQRIFEISESEIIIDSSKYPSWGYFLYKLNFTDFYFIHLERRLADVANSWKKIQLLPEYNYDVFMPVKSNFTILKSWIKIKFLCDKIKKEAGNKYIFVHYNFFCLHQNKFFARIESFLNIYLKKDDLKFKENHAIGGNPMRNNAKRLEIKNSKSDYSNLNKIEVVLFKIINYTANRVYD
jgi:hypothetical protein